MAITLSIPDRFAEFFHCCKEHDTRQEHEQWRRLTTPMGGNPPSPVNASTGRARITRSTSC